MADHSGFSDVSRLDLLVENPTSFRKGASFLARNVDSLVY